jgi:hypothetical protein
MGYDLVKRTAEPKPLLPHGTVEEEFREIYDRSATCTMTTPLEMYNLYIATRYIVEADIAGDVVECGVWKGGSAMVSASTLLTLGDTSRSLYLYDTYEGMPESSEMDITYHGQSAEELRTRLHDDEDSWNFAPVEEVRANLLATGYPEDRLNLVVGKVEETIPATVPERISILRLDTDFYESTRHELHHLFPRLARGGVLIVDDYDFWKGAKQATDEYFAEAGIKMLLHRMDVGRIGIKP